MTGGRASVGEPQCCTVRERGVRSLCGFPAGAQNFELGGSVRGRLPSEGGGLSTGASFTPSDTHLKSGESFTCFILLERHNLMETGRMGEKRRGVFEQLAST